MTKFFFNNQSLAAVVVKLCVFSLMLIFIECWVGFFFKTVSLVWASFHNWFPCCPFFKIFFYNKVEGGICEGWKFNADITIQTQHFMSFRYNTYKSHQSWCSAKHSSMAQSSSNVSGIQEMCFFTPALLLNLNYL